MQITITIPDSQWQEFKELAQEAVDSQWNGSYEDFAAYIMNAWCEIDQSAPGAGSFHKNRGKFLYCKDVNWLEKSRCLFHFTPSVMSVNIDTYIKSQKAKQEKKMKKALAAYEESLKKEQETLEAKPEPVVSLPTKEPEPKPIAVPMTDSQISARIERIQAVPVRKRTLEQTNELKELIEMRKKRKV